MRLASILFVLALSAVSRVSHAQGEPVPLRPGDRVFVRVAADSVWDNSLAVDTDEQIFLPHVGAVSIRGVPARQVGDVVRRALASVYRTADATVVPLRRVTVTGEVKKTGTYFLPIESSLRDAVAVTEGVTDIGNQDRLVFVQDVDRSRGRAAVGLVVGLDGAGAAGRLGALAQFAPPSSMAKLTPSVTTGNATSCRHK